MNDLYRFKASNVRCNITSLQCWYPFWLILLCFLFWGPHLIVLRSSSLQCIHISLLAKLRGPYMLPKIESESAVYKTISYPQYYCSAPTFWLSNKASGNMFQLSTILPQFCLCHVTYLLMWQMLISLHFCTILQNIQFTICLYMYGYVIISSLTFSSM